jgi:hypothetical protein
MQTESKQILIAWTRQFGLATSVYVLALILATWSATVKNPGEVAFVLAPIAPGLWLIWLTVNAYRHTDEFIQHRILQAASLAALIAAAFALVYSFLEVLGCPHLSLAWISNLIWAVFVAQMVKLMVAGK